MDFRWKTYKKIEKKVTNINPRSVTVTATLPYMKDIPAVIERYNTENLTWRKLLINIKERYEPRDQQGDLLRISSHLYWKTRKIIEGNIKTDGLLQ